MHLNAFLSRLKQFPLLVIHFNKNEIKPGFIKKVTVCLCIVVVASLHRETLEAYQRPSGRDLSLHSYTNNVKKHTRIEEIRVPFKSGCII